MRYDTIAISNQNIFFSFFFFSRRYSIFIIVIIMILFLVELLCLNNMMGIDEGIQLCCMTTFTASIHKNKLNSWRCANQNAASLFLFISRPTQIGRCWVLSMSTVDTEVQLYCVMRQLLSRLLLPIDCYTHIRCPVV